jgi:hypothetical protein
MHSNPLTFGPPNITLGKGCCGRVAPAGSDGPGMRLMGNAEERISERTSERVLVGWEG